VRRRGAASIAANPVLIGAATTLVVIVAVFLAYNANNGLPFVPTYDLKLEVPNAANLVRGNEVRIGGSRVGVINEITARRYPDGRTTAVLNLQMETTVQPLPVDSTALIRPRSALGLKYVELTKGTSREGFANGATIPLANARPEPVEIDEVFNMFDEPTRAGSRTNLTEFGTAFAARGQSLNDALAVFPALLGQLQPVMENLADPRTDLAGFFRGLGQAAAEAAPVAEEQAALFRNLDTTLGALSDVRDSLQESIETGPEALEAATESFPVQRPFLVNSTRFFGELRPGIRALRLAAPDLSRAFEIGQPALRRSVELNQRLESTFRALQRFAEDPMTSLGLNGLRTTAQILRPTVADLRGVQATCNYVTLFFRNAASLLSEGDRNGTWQRFIIVAAPSGDNNEGGPASAPANGPTGNGPENGGTGEGAQLQQLPSPPAAGADRNFLHQNPFPNAAQPGATRECEAGNEDWIPNRPIIGNVPGNQGLATNRTTVQRDSPGSLPAQPGENERGAQQAPSPGAYGPAAGGR
jgi:virulence factor Mce-like protein